MNNPNESMLQKERIKYKPKLPPILQNLSSIKLKEIIEGKSSMDISSYFPKTINQKVLKVFADTHSNHNKPLQVAVVLSGGQAAGGHNVIAGIYDALKNLNRDSKLIGFCNGPSGILKNETIEITDTMLASYRNQGGFDLIGSGRTKIETDEQFQAADAVIQKLDLDGLVIIGGDDSNTNAALLAEYFEQRGRKCRVIGVPKTIDGDLRSKDIEISFGFDSACKTYSEIIGNIARDALSAKKYYYFIKLMGRSASHITLECALQTHPNMALISEEVKNQNKRLSEIVCQIADLVCKRAVSGKNYGVILIPEGIIEFIPEFDLLIKELNRLLSKNNNSNINSDAISKLLSEESKHCFDSLPSLIQDQLLLDRDPHGNVQVSKIETERLFIEMVAQELIQRKSTGNYKGTFNSQPLFCGYEGRSCMPSNFDSDYCYALGHVAALLINFGATGYISCVKNLIEPIEKWEIAGIPLVQLMDIEERMGKVKPVIKKALVELDSPAFLTFNTMREKWGLDDCYRYPGPIQFFGPPEISNSRPITMS